MARGSYLRALFIGALALQLCACDWFVSPAERVERARQRVSNGDDRGAVIELQNALKAEPGQVPARLLLAEASLRLGDPGAAAKEVAVAVEHGATADAVAPLNAEILLATNKPQELLTSIESSKSGLQDPGLSTYRGLALLRLNRRDEASAEFRKVLAASPDQNRARVGLAEVLASSGDSQAALDELAQALAKNGGDATALALRGDVLLARGEYAEAVSALEAARREAPGQLGVAQRVRVVASLTEAYLGQGAVDKAQEAHATLAEIVPEAAMTRLLAARIALAKRDYAAAVAEAHKALASAPGMLQAKFVLAVAAVAQGNLNQAEVQLSELLQAAPDNLEARKMLARVNLQLRRPEVAAELLSNVQTSGEDDPQLSALLGMANLQRGKLDQGIALLESSLASRPDDARLKYDLAMAYVAAGNRQKAIALLRSIPQGDASRDSLLVTVVAMEEGPEAARAQIEQLANARPDDVESITRAGALHAQQGNLDAARSTLARALKVDPKSVPTMLVLARVESAANNSARALEVVQQAAEVDPANEGTRLLWADLAFREGDVATAIRELEEVRTRNPEALKPRLALARAYFSQQKTSEAEAVLREVEARAKNDAELLSGLGQVNLESRRYREAQHWFREAMTLDAANPRHHLNVARAQLAGGETGAARQTLEKAGQAHPTDAAIGVELIRLDLRDGRQKAALDRLQRLKAAHPDDPALLVLDGDIAFVARSYAAAAAAYEAAAKRSASGSIAVRIYRARRQGGLSDPTAPLTQWLARSPDDSAVRIALAEHHVATNQEDRAIQEYERVLRGNPRNAVALNNLAWLYHQKRDARALATGRQAHELAPQEPSIADTYGWILVESGNVAAGLPILEKAASQGAQPDIRYHYAAALARAGKHDAALRELQALLKSATSFASSGDAQKLLAELGG